MIIPGYVAGLGCLFLVTYRTLIAYFSETKSVTIFIDKFGEQYIDLIALIIIWTICIFGLLILFRILKEEKDKELFSEDIDRKLILKNDSSYFDVENKPNVKMHTGEVMGIMAESPNDTEQN